MASLAQRVQDHIESELLVCPQTPRIKPKRLSFPQQQEEIFSLGQNDSLGSSGLDDDSQDDGLGDIFRQKDSIFTFLNHMKLRKRSF